MCNENDTDKFYSDQWIQIKTRNLSLKIQKEIIQHLKMENENAETGASHYNIIKHIHEQIRSKFCKPVKQSCLHEQISPSKQLRITSSQTLSYILK